MKRPPPPPPPPSGVKGTPPPPPPLSGLKKPPGTGKKMTEIDTPAGVTKVIFACMLYIGHQCCFASLRCKLKQCCTGTGVTAAACTQHYSL